MNKEYFCTLEEERSRVLYFVEDMPAMLYLRYKPVPH